MCAVGVHRTRQNTIEPDRATQTNSNAFTHSYYSSTHASRSVSLFSFLTWISLCLATEMRVLSIFFWYFRTRVFVYVSCVHVHLLFHSFFRMAYHRKNCAMFLLCIYLFVFVQVKRNALGQGMYAWFLQKLLIDFCSCFHDC